MIEVKDLVKEYPGKLAVDRVSFSIGRGETVGLLGANGAGKSTIMNIIAGCTAMTSGTVTVDGLDILDEPVAARKKIGYLPELPPIYSDMTVEEYLSFVYDLKKCRTNRKEDIARACGALDIADVRGRLIRKLSKGYRQRVGFAQALIGNPDVLIFDEPTVGLDPKQIIEIRKVIQGLGKQHTIIISSHILSEIQTVCQRVLVVDRGRLVADDSTERLSQKASGTETIRLRVVGEERAIGQRLLAVGGLKSVKKTGGTKDGGFGFLVEADGKEDGARTRLRITKELAESGLYVVEMSAERANLEDVFLRLTSGKNPAKPSTPRPSPEESSPAGQEKRKRGTEVNR